MLLINRDLFLLINASGHPTARAIGWLSALANSPLLICPAILVALWIWGRPARRGALLAILGALLVGQGINQLLGLLWFEPRPFMVGLGQTLVAHAADNGFPSDHATLVFVLGFGLLATGVSPLLGRWVCAYGVLIAWVRVYLGVHFPIDMVVSAMVGAGAAQLAARAEPFIATWLLPAPQALYERALAILHVPSRMVPRLPRQPG